MSCCGKAKVRHNWWNGQRKALLEEDDVTEYGVVEAFFRYLKGGEIMRPSCKNCAMKHISQARALLLETDKGEEYRHHYWFAMGHLAEAEDETVNDFPAATEAIRTQRKHLEDDRSYQIDFNELLDVVEHAETIHRGLVKEG